MQAVRERWGAFWELCEVSQFFYKPASEKANSDGGVLGWHLQIFNYFYPPWLFVFRISAFYYFTIDDFEGRTAKEIWLKYLGYLQRSHLQCSSALLVSSFPNCQFSLITDVALNQKKAPMPIFTDIYREHIFGSPSTFFVNRVFLVFLFVLQLGLLCLVQRSKPCQHITLFIRQRCYQISLRLEETLLSNNYRIYIYVLPVRETLKRCVSVGTELGLLVQCWIGIGWVRGGAGSESPTGVGLLRVSGEFRWKIHLFKLKFQ